MLAANSGDSVAIVGAGIAGLSCAQQLTQAGMHVTVFEKSRGPGGRMSTRRVQSPDNLNDQTWQCDHGAQYFTARDPLFIAEVKRWQQLGVAAPWQAVVKSIGRRPDATHKSATDKQPLVTERYVGIPRMTAPAHLLASNLKMITGARIVMMSASADGWHLQRENDTNTSGPFKNLVLALPAQQTTELLTGLLAGKLNNPQQATHSRSVEHALLLSRQLALRPCWALMLNFADAQSGGIQNDRTIQTPYNKSGPGFDAAFVNPDTDQPPVVSWITRNNSKPGRPYDQGDTWLIHATLDWSEQHLECAQNQVQDILLAEFRRLTGITAEISASSLQRWRYAQTGPQHTQKHNSPGSLWLPDINSAAHGTSLGLCGDWLNGGRVEGAWLSGYHLARQMIDG